MKIQLAKLSRQLTAHGRNGSSSAMVLKTTPLRQLLQGFSCALLLLLPLHSPPTSTHPATLPTQEQGKITETGKCHHTTPDQGQSDCWAPRRALVGFTGSKSLEHPASPLGLPKV